MGLYTLRNHVQSMKEDLRKTCSELHDQVKMAYSNSSLNLDSTIPSFSSAQAEVVLKPKITQASSHQIAPN